jgi:Tol biopolymer transport system component
MIAKINRLGLLAAVVGRLVAVGLLVLMVVMEARPGEATFPGKNGKITYVTLTAPRGEEIYTINPDRSGRFRVTNTKNTDEERPDYSPDGKKIAYSGCPYRSDCEIYTISATGGKPVQVTNNKTPDLEPSFSPNGKKIAYAGTGRKTDYEIYTISATGGKRVQVTNNKTEDGDPSYSPDGKKIAYVRGGDRKTDSEIYTNNAGGGGRVQVTHNGTDNFWPSWGNRP